MISVECMLDRRNFLRGSAGTAVGLCAAPLLESVAAAENAWTIGPQPGFTPEVGTLTSMLAFTRAQVVHNVQGLSQQDLDYLLDANANSIGALLLHPAATETYYQMNTLAGRRGIRGPKR